MARAMAALMANVMEIGCNGVDRMVMTMGSGDGVRKQNNVDKI